MVLRGAYGMFFERHPTTLAANVKSLNGGDGVRTFLATLPSMVPVTAWATPERQLPEPSTPFLSVIQTVDPALKSPYAHHASGGIDRELPGQVLASANVVWIRGANQLGVLDYNPIVAELGPGRRPLDVNGVAGTSTSVSQLTSYGTTWYRGLMLSLSTHRQRHQFLASYTWSRAEDNVTDYIGGPENNGGGRDPGNPHGLPLGFDPSAERGPSVHDQRHRLVLSGFYEAPFDLQLSSIVTAASGRPYSVLAGFDFNRDGSPTDRARGNPQSAPSDYSTSVRRNSERLPGSVIVDVRCVKRFQTSGRVSLDVLIEAFNVFNHVAFNQINTFFGPGAYPSSPAAGFGQFTPGRSAATGASRCESRLLAIAGTGRQADLLDELLEPRILLQPVEMRVDVDKGYVPVTFADCRSSATRLLDRRHRCLQSNKRRGSLARLRFWPPLPKPPSFQLSFAWAADQREVIAQTASARRRSESCFERISVKSSADFPLI